VAIFSIIKYVVILLIVVAIGSGLWYVTNLKADLATSEANNQKLQDGIKEQQMLLEQMQQDVITIQETNKVLQQQNEKQRQDVNNLTSKFDKRDFGAFAASKPDVVQKLINRGTVNAMRCFELAAGAPLNETELSAKTPSEANRECPSLINPAYTNPN
jgi:hypothetical protein